jgi:uncharacterized protein YukE
MTERTSAADLHNCEQAVMAAARKERAAHAALQEGINPLHPSWTESDEEAYEARLAHWRAASRALVDALNRLKASRHGERPPARNGAPGWPPSPLNAVSRRARAGLRAPRNRRG